MDINGVINIYKESGYTSHDVVAIVRKSLGKVKVGHTGTLDPQAQGVLPICIGKATKISNYLSSDIKSYRAVLKLGITTDTQDTTGNILTTSEVECNIKDIESCIMSFIGEYNQIPPMYSAIKVNGKKLYDLARQGKEVKREGRNIKIYDIKILRFLSKSKVEIDVVCSKGTYIRTLCHDIGCKLGVGGAMDSLLRLSSGKFNLEQSIKIDEFKELVNNNSIKKFIISLDKIMDNYPKAFAKKDANKYLYNGNIVKLEYIDTITEVENLDKILLYDYNQTLIGLYEVVSNEVKPVVILTDLTIM